MSFFTFLIIATVLWFLGKFIWTFRGIFYFIGVVFVLWLFLTNFLLFLTIGLLVGGVIFGLTYSDKPKVKERETREDRTDTDYERLSYKNTQSQNRWDSKDPYVILGVKRSMPMNQIKTKYKLLSKNYHPDVSLDPDADKIMKKINWAWDELRSAY
ncbi:DnaJ domain-containing protein [Streptococcus sp. zg-JUN1979]|uniref:DnaJ domain-containing protein n=1 Tax=Streptococcus sp. zg-JUN1979 TaxID=3391450 RepID=UPI0039A40277